MIAVSHFNLLADELSLFQGQVRSLKNFAIFGQFSVFINLTSTLARPRKLLLILNQSSLCPWESSLTRYRTTPWPMQRTIPSAMDLSSSRPSTPRVWRAKSMACCTFGRMLFGHFVSRSSQQSGLCIWWRFVSELGCICLLNLALKKAMIFPCVQIVAPFGLTTNVWYSEMISEMRRPTDFWKVSTVVILSCMTNTSQRE
jgi:hypothetical protein